MTLLKLFIVLDILAVLILAVMFIAHLWRYGRNRWWEFFWNIHP